MSKFVPVGVSNRHAHLSAEHVQALFGHDLTNIKNLIQPGVFAADEMVTLVGPKGSIEKVRILGPVRPDTQVEILASDSFKLGIVADFRISGDLDTTPSCKLVGPVGEVVLEKGVIVALRHLHLAPDEALEYGLSDGDIISVKVPGARGGTLDNVVVRSGTAHKLELHIDTEEANALGAKNGDELEIV